MDKPAIQVDGVSKKYSRNAGQHLSYAFFDLLEEVRGKRNSALRKDEFYAVNDVSLEIMPGDSFALMGRNGSGKTTLLKMMNGLVKPDRGSITMRGQVQALINLGTGFTASLTGRENIYNSASLIGLNFNETTALLDEILDFSEMEDFIDSPIGTYSSGMKARLGFAVAVCIKPDILLVDEILAVGDMAFQNKCFTRMEQLKKEGVTFVLVSHSHTKMSQFCNKGLWLHQGEIRASGTSQECIQAYTSFLEASDSDADAANVDLYGPVYPPEGRVENIHGEFYLDDEKVDSFPIFSDVTFKYAFTLKEEVEKLHVTIVIHSIDGTLVAAISSLEKGLHLDIHNGHVSGEIHIPDFDLLPGSYVVMMPICDGKRYLYRQKIFKFTVSGNGENFVGVKAFKHTHKVDNEKS